MKLCKKCNSVIPCSINIDGVACSLKNRKYCLECSPYNTHNTKKLEVKKNDDKKHCNKCKQVKDINQFYKKYAYCKECSKANLKEYQKRIKLECVEYKGGSCRICGYNKCLSSLCFHHLNPKEKDFQISDSRIFKLDKLKDELDKCILVCGNCHAEIHAGMHPNIHSQAL